MVYNLAYFKRKSPTNSSSGQFKASLFLHTQKRATSNCRWARRYAS